LGDLLRRSALAAQPVLEQEHVQRQHLETAKRRVGYIPVGIKHSLPRRRHDLCVKRLGDGAVGMAFAAKKALEHWGWSPGTVCLVGFVASAGKLVYRCCGPAQVAAI